MLTQERAAALTEVLTSDAERGKVLVTMEPAEALAQINALGYDFTLEELNEYGEALKAAAAQEEGELDADKLEDVTGGSALAIAGAIGIAFVAGAAVGGLEKAKVW